MTYHEVYQEAYQNKYKKTEEVIKRLLGSDDLKKFKKLIEEETGIQGYDEEKTACIITAVLEQEMLRTLDEAKEANKNKHTPTIAELYSPKEYYKLMTDRCEAMKGAYYEWHVIEKDKMEEICNFPPYPYDKTLKGIKTKFDAEEQAINDFLAIYEPLCNDFDEMVPDIHGEL